MNRPTRRSLWIAFAGLALLCAVLVVRDGGFGVVFWAVVISALLGVAAARTPITDAAAAVRRLGRLLGVGVFAGGVLAAAIVAVIVYVDLSQPNVDPSNLSLRRVAREASQGGGAGVIFGALFGVVVWVVSLAEAFWKRRRAVAVAEWPAWTRPAAVLAPVIAFAAGSEGLLANEDLVAGCSSSGVVFPLSLASRAFCVAVAAGAFLGASLLVRAEPSPRPRRRASFAAALGLSGVLSLLLGYTAYSGSPNSPFHWGWLFMYASTLPVGDALRGAEVQTEEDAFGRVLVVRPREGRGVRWRLSLGPFSTVERDKLVRLVRFEAGQD